VRIFLRHSNSIGDFAETFNSLSQNPEFLARFKLLMNLNRTFISSLAQYMDTINAPHNLLQQVQSINPRFGLPHPDEVPIGDLRGFS